jgi:hypothetical protein
MFNLKLVCSTLIRNFTPPLISIKNQKVGDLVPKAQNIHASPSYGRIKKRGAFELSSLLPSQLFPKTLQSPFSAINTSTT